MIVRESIVIIIKFGSRIDRYMTKSVRHGTVVQVNAKKRYLAYLGKITFTIFLPASKIIFSRQCL